MKSARSILPAVAPKGTTPHVESSKNKVTKKRNTVSRACNGCRRIKCKCDGIRPVCAKCQERETECVYDTEEGKSRNASLRDNNEALSEALSRHKEVFATLLHGDISQDSRDLIRSLGLSPPSSPTSPQSNIHDNTPTSETQDFPSVPQDASFSAPSFAPLSARFGSTDQPSLSEDAFSFFSQYQPPISQDVFSFPQGTPSLPTEDRPSMPLDSSQSIFPWVPTSPLADTAPTSFREAPPPFPDGEPSSSSSQSFPYTLGAPPSLAARSRPEDTAVHGPPPPPGWSNASLSPFRRALEYDHQHDVKSHPQSNYRPNPGHDVRGNSRQLHQIPPPRDYYTGSSQTGNGYPPAEALSSGYDPNDGRVSGKQEGWHFLLVVREAEEIISFSMPARSRDVEYLRFYQNKTASAMYSPFGTQETTPPESHSSLSRNRSTDDDSDSQHPSVEGLHGAAVTAFGNLPMSSAVLANGYPSSTQNQQMLNFRVPEHMIPSLVVDENSDLARLYIGFKDAAQQMIANGLSAAQILEDLNSVYVDLLLRARTPDDSVSVCNWASELMKNVLGMDRYVHLAWAGLLARYMRWVILPTKANYAQIPDMMKPTRIQRLIPHSPALDLVPHPGMRDALMQHYVDWLTNLQVDHSRLLVWSGTEGEAVTVCANTGRLKLTPEFEKATQIQDNWSVNSNILSIYAEPSRFGIRVRDTDESAEARAVGGQHDHTHAHQNVTRKSINTLEDIRSDQKHQRLEKITRIQSGSHWKLN